MNHELIVLKTKLSRGIKVNKSRLKALQAGVEGEAKFREFVLAQKLDHLLWIDDYWVQIEESPKRQADFILILPYEWLVIDVKNYHTSFEYREGKCYSNGWPEPMDNIIALAQNRNQLLQRIANDITQNITVRSALVFINENCHVTQDNTPCDIELIPRTKLRIFLEKFRATKPVHQWLADKTFEHLNKYHCEYGFPFCGLKPEEFSVVKKGILCGDCGSYHMEISKLFVKCLNCSKKESKRDVVHRHAIQLRYLFYDNPQMLTVKNLVALMGGEIPQRIVRMHMYNLFKVVNRGSASYYPIDLSRKSQLKLIKR
ncbi:nuclease-related domain-containing protein [Fundicoccus sp. Sow4_H7]|uniref:nuclease-related domain-containing protein n=1 Tax=Fundicoccus sp. Sow4_H7 TaxID=3438784 RepID=UPI003F8FE2DE